jgi:hypothetical protein
MSRSRFHADIARATGESIHTVRADTRSCLLKLTIKRRSRPLSPPHGNKNTEPASSSRPRGRFWTHSGGLNSG